MEAAGSSSSGGGGRRAVSAAITSSPEKKVNRFVRAVALIEKLGNALGTLVFTWATVVLLGGYPTVLAQGQDSDFCYAVFIVSLEALRMFNRENSMDCQLFFRSRGSVRHLGWNNGLIVVAWLSNVLVTLSYLLPAPTASAASAIRLRKLLQVLAIFLLLLTAVISKFLSPGALRLLPVTVRRFISLTSPLAAVLLLVPSLVKAASTKQSHMVANWVMFTLLLAAVLVLTVSRLQFPSITKLLDTGLGSKHVFWRRLILSACMLAELMILEFIHDSLTHRIVMATFQVYALSSVLFDNLLMPTAVLRVVLALRRLVVHDYNSGSAEEQQENRINLEPSLDIFYTIVLCQGVVHIVSCTLELFSFIPRNSLARQCGFSGHRGSELANLYYEYAREKCMEMHAVARKQISLNSFVIHCISSDSPKLQLHGVWMMHNLLGQEPSRTQLLSKLHRDANATARLINMLEWRTPEDAAIRLFAAKVMASAMLAGTLRIISIPGAIEAFSALLDADDSGGTETEPPQDCLPALALSIFDSLVNNNSYYFHSNCLKISKEADELIPKIVQFTCCYRDDGSGTQEHNINEAAAAVEQRRCFLMGSALQLLGRLSSIGGKTGMRLRQELVEHTTLERNLAAILDDNSFSSQEARKLAIVVLGNLCHVKVVAPLDI